MSDKIYNYIVEKEDERPARPDGTCFYCHQPIGGLHGFGCVIVRRPVKVRVTIETTLETVASWSDETYEQFWRNGSSCQNNIIQEMLDSVPENDCLCGRVKVEVIDKFSRPGMNNDT